MNIRLFREPGAHSESEYVLVSYLGGGDVDLAVIVDVLVELLVDHIGRLESETNESHGWRNGQLKPFISPDHLSKLFSEVDMCPDVLLESCHSVQTQNKPDFEGTKSAA